MNSLGDDALILVTFSGPSLRKPSRLTLVPTRDVMPLDIPYELAVVLPLLAKKLRKSGPSRGRLPLTMATPCSRVVQVAA